MEQPFVEHRSEPFHSLELHAYSLWEQRGRPWGTPEIDWFRAEREMRAQQSLENQDASSEPFTVTTAKIVGAVLGSVTGVVAAVSNSLTSE